MAPDLDRTRIYDVRKAPLGPLLDLPLQGYMTYRVMTQGKCSNVPSLVLKRR